MSIDKFDVAAEFEALHRSYPAGNGRPVVGITANFRDGNAALAEAYYASVLEAGGVPLIIPPYPCREALLEKFPSAGLARLTDSSFALTEKGFYLSNSIIAELI